MTSELATFMLFCTKCDRWRMGSCFHKDRTRSSGFARWCRDCVSVKTSTWASANRKRKNATDLAWKRRNRIKARAHAAVRRALKTGELVKPEACGCCGAGPYSAPFLEAHHVNYRRPLDVRWLCKRCHAAHHQWGKK